MLQFQFLKSCILYFSIFVLTIGCQQNENNDSAINVPKQAESQIDSPAIAPIQAPSFQSNDLTPHNDFPYIHHIKNSGKKPVSGNFVQYHYRLYKDGQLEQNSYERGMANPMGMRFPDLEEIKSNPQAIIEGISLMGEGDSLTISTEGSQVRGNFLYEIFVVKIISLNN